MSKFFDKVKDLFLKVKNSFIKPDKVHVEVVESVDDVTPHISPQTIEEGSTFIITQGSPPADSPKNFDVIQIGEPVVEPVVEPVIIERVIDIIDSDGVVHALQVSTENLDSPVDSPADSALSSLD